MLIRRQDGVPLVAHCWLLDDGMVAVALREVGKQRAQVLHLAAYFEWTEAEGHLAQGLLDNLTVHEFAAIQGVAVSTVRTHLIGLFKKTGTRRQAELIRLLLQLQ